MQCHKDQCICALYFWRWSQSHFAIFTVVPTFFDDILVQNSVECSGACCSLVTLHTSLHVRSDSQSVGRDDPTLHWTTRMSESAGGSAQCVSVPSIFKNPDKVCFCTTHNTKDFGFQIFFSLLSEGARKLKQYSIKGMNIKCLYFNF